MVLWPLLTSCTSVLHCCKGSWFGGTIRQSPCKLRARPPQVRAGNLHPIQPPYLHTRVRVALDFALLGKLVRPVLPYIRFLFVGPGFCLQLPSYSTSRWTPLLLANASCYRAHSGLSPPGYHPCWAHLHNTRPPLRVGRVFFEAGQPQIPAQDQRRTSAPQDLHRARTIRPPGCARRSDELSNQYTEKIPANVACMLLLQFSGNPLYILFFYLFLFFRKHKQNRKRNIVIGESE